MRDLAALFYVNAHTSFEGYCNYTCSTAAVSLALESVPLMLAFDNTGMVNISSSTRCSAGRRTAVCRLTGAGSVWRAAVPGGHLAVQLKCPVTDQRRCNAIYLAGAPLSGYRVPTEGRPSERPIWWRSG